LDTALTPELGPKIGLRVRCHRRIDRPVAKPCTACDSLPKSRQRVNSQCRERFVVSGDFQKRGDFIMLMVADVHESARCRQQEQRRRNMVFEIGAKLPSA